jgi:hypothetical protein
MSLFSCLFQRSRSLQLIDFGFWKAREFTDSFVVRTVLPTRIRFAVMYAGGVFDLNAFELHRAFQLNLVHDRVEIQLSYPI